MAAKKHSVSMIFKARDLASKKLGGLISKLNVFKGTMGKIAGAMMVYFGARQIIRGMKGSLEAFGQQELAIKKLSDALDLLGHGGQTNMRHMRNFASEIQKMTDIGDEAVLELMSMGASLGGLSGKPLQDTTKAVIGLQASIQKIDLQTTMMLFAKAAAGDFATLSRYGIKLDASLSKQEKFNKLLEIGGEKFVLAEGRTKTYLGTVEQMKNILGDIKEVIGEALMPTFLEWAKTVKDWGIENMDSISAWAKKTVAAVGLVKNSFKAFLGYMKKDWIDGFEWVFESLLKIIQTTMQTAVMAAIAGGKGIWAGIKKGILGENEERLNQKIAAMHKAEGADGKGFVEPLAFGMKKTGTYYRIRAEAEKQLLEADTKKLLGVTWSAIGDTWKDAMKDILNSAPGELQASWRDIWQKFLAKIKQIDATGGAGGALGPLTGGMGGDAGAGGKGAVGEAGSMFRSLNPLISRFLNRDPRNRNNPEERTARATEKIMEYDGTMAGHVKEISDNIRKIAAGGGPQLAEGKL